MNRGGGGGRGGPRRPERWSRGGGQRRRSELNRGKGTAREDDSCGRLPPASIRPRPLLVGVGPAARSPGPRRPMDYDAHGGDRR
jgi:hypothetical protein